MPTLRSSSQLLLLFSLTGLASTGCDADGGSTLGFKTQAALENSIGVAECDSYLAQYEDCVRTHAPSHYQNAALSGADKKRQAWARMAESEFKKDALGRICSAAIDAAKDDLGEWGCTWQDTTCGNGALEFGEGCDDGNSTAGDGCSPSCFVESTDGGDDSAGDGDTSGGGGEMIDACDESTATDLSVPGTSVTVSADACVRVRDGYPSWWSTRNMKLGNEAGSGYPISFTWSNSCAGSSGSGSFTADWQTVVFGPTSDACATLVQLEGDSATSIKLKYFGE